jgi:hypothetical protein
LQKRLTSSWLPVEAAARVISAVVVVLVVYDQQSLQLVVGAHLKVP